MDSKVLKVFRIDYLSFCEQILVDERETKPTPLTATSPNWNTTLTESLTESKSLNSILSKCQYCTHSRVSLLEVLRSYRYSAFINNHPEELHTMSTGQCCQWFRLATPNSSKKCCRRWPFSKKCCRRRRCQLWPSCLQLLDHWTCHCVADRSWKRQRLQLSLLLTETQSIII